MNKNKTLGKLHEKFFKVFYIILFITIFIAICIYSFVVSQVGAIFIYFSFVLNEFTNSYLQMFFNEHIVTFSNIKYYIIIIQF